jgi:hypothetical protein
VVVVGTVPGVHDPAVAQGGAAMGGHCVVGYSHNLGVTHDIGRVSEHRAHTF